MAPGAGLRQCPGVPCGLWPLVLWVKSSAWPRRGPALTAFLVPRGFVFLAVHSVFLGRRRRHFQCVRPIGSWAVTLPPRLPCASSQTSSPCFQGLFLDAWVLLLVDTLVWWPET